MRSDNLTYKGYTGVVGFEATKEGGLFFGRLIGLNNDHKINFEGQSVEELIKDFEEAVDDFIEACEAEGVEPKKPYSGIFNLRVPPELHKEISLDAERCGLSMNAWVVKAIELRLRTEAEKVYS